MLLEPGQGCEDQGRKRREAVRILLLGVRFPCLEATQSGVQMLRAAAALATACIRSGGLHEQLIDCETIASALQARFEAVVGRER